MKFDGIARPVNGRPPIMGTVRLQLLLAFFLVLGVASGVSAQPQVEYFQTDAVGSVRVVTNQGGAVVRRHDYLAFGEEVAPQPCQPNGNDARRFTGKVRDWESCLDYFEARYYRSASGRFSTVDPLLDVEDAIADPQQWNRYAYARNNPLYYADPDGRQLQPLLAWIANALNSPTAQRVGEALATQRANLVMLARQWMASPATPQLLQTVGEVATGADIPGGLPAATGAADLLPPKVAGGFVGPVHRFVAKSDITAFRFWSPHSGSEEIGKWLTTRSTASRILSPKEAVEALNLNPSGNLATSLSRITIPKGTEVFVGRVRNGKSWATQIWIRDKSRLRVLGQVDDYGIEK